MIRTIKAMIDEHGSVLQEEVSLSAPRRALFTILEEQPYANETALLSEVAWSYLQRRRNPGSVSLLRLVSDHAAPKSTGT